MGAEEMHRPRQTDATAGREADEVGGLHVASDASWSGGLVGHQCPTRTKLPNQSLASAWIACRVPVSCRRWCGAVYDRACTRTQLIHAIFFTYSVGLFTV